MKWFNGIPENIDHAVERLDDIGGPNSHSNIPWGWAQVGNYAIQFNFSDGHKSGLYTYEYLRDLARHP